MVKKSEPHSSRVDTSSTAAPLALWKKVMAPEPMDSMVSNIRGALRRDHRHKQPQAGGVNHHIVY